MGAELWVALGVILTAVVGLTGHFLLRPRIRAETRKLSAEADQINWETLKGEIDRLQEKVGAQDKRIAELEQSLDRRAVREDELELENSRLRSQVRRLERRVRAMEGIFKIGPLSPAMQAELDKLKNVD